MTEPGATPEGAPAGTPRVPLDQQGRENVLADWIAVQRGSFTDAALERSAIEAGYSSEEFVASAGLAADRTALAPIRSSARRYVLVAYAVVWLGFAVVYLGRSTMYGAGPIAQLVLTVSLAIGLAISLLVIRRGRPDPDKRPRALALLLAVPVILLLGVAGLCLPFTNVQ